MLRPAMRLASSLFSTSKHRTAFGRSPAKAPKRISAAAGSERCRRSADTSISNAYPSDRHTRRSRSTRVIACDQRRQRTVMRQLSSNGHSIRHGYERWDRPPRLPEKTRKDRPSRLSLLKINKKAMTSIRPSCNLLWWHAVARHWLARVMRKHPPENSEVS